ncbi:MAG: uroporphyrinogen-III synthase [Polyangiales bacterium]
MAGRVDFVGTKAASADGDLEGLIDRARGGEVVVREVCASPFLDDAALAEIQAVSEAGVQLTVTPPPSVRAAPLFGKRVAITRAASQARETARVLRRRGARPVFLPTIEIGAPDDPSALAAAVRALATYDVVALTSANGVDALFAAMAEAKVDARAFGAAKIAAIGPGTRVALERHGIRADFEPEEHRGEGLARAILAVGPKRVLLPRAAIAREVLPEMLREAGVAIDVVEAYRTRRPSDDAIGTQKQAFLDDPPHAITFTSSSTVENFVELFPVEALANVVVASIGPITSETCKRLGVRVDVEAKPYTLPALVDALEGQFSDR